MVAADVPLLFCAAEELVPLMRGPQRGGACTSERASVNSSAGAGRVPSPRPRALPHGGGLGHDAPRGFGTRPNVCRTAGVVVAASRSGRGSGLTWDAVVGARRHGRGPTSDDSSGREMTWGAVSGAQHEVADPSGPPLDRFAGASDPSGHRRTPELQIPMWCTGVWIYRESNGGIGI